MRRILLAVMAAAYFLPVSAFAGLAAYEYTGTRDDGLWAMSGSIVFEESDLVAGDELIDKIVSWEFNWTNGPETISTSSDTSDINWNLGPPTFKVDDSLAIVEFQFENTYGEDRFPLIGFEANGERFSYTVVPYGCCQQGSGSFSGPELIVEFVGVDIKPGSDTSCNAVIPVAVLGSAEFDVTQIDTATLSFAGANPREKGNGALSCNTSDVNYDGFADLVCQYQNATAEGALAGSLLDGTEIQGSDVYCVTP
jgi:hypothetical protein